MSWPPVPDVETIRANSAPLLTTVAPSVSSDSFKLVNGHAKPKSKKLDHHFSIESRGFSGSALKRTASVRGEKKVIPLGTGRPTADYYPWDTLSFEGKRPSLDTLNRSNTLASYPVTKQDEAYNLSLALNYGNAVGSPHLLRFLTEHTEIVHSPPYADWNTCLTVGSTSAMELAFRIFCNRGDNVLMEEYTYPGTVEGASLLDLKVHDVQMDAEGASAVHLRRILSTWDASRGPKPAVFYTIPSGQNPTGATQSLKRRKEIYQVAEEHDLIIIEDDPYYFLRLGRRGVPPGNATNLVPSYVSIDASGRVVRLDSTSKILAPGLRAGWVTASAPVIDKFIAYQEVSTVAVAGPIQLMLWTLLDKSWGHRGFFSWLDALSLQYRSRRDLTVDACDRYLPKEVCSWVEPDYGMFLWVKLDWKKHPRFQNQPDQQNIHIQLAEIENRILSVALMEGVQVTKGSLFHCTKKPSDKLHFRLTFAAALREDLEEGVKIFAHAVNSEFALVD
ncbi:pyridoxal phosphate-dependent transferase [Xylaria grammica]|nr:pyridoxal phosphate-dependent transferase [Xylaria grammica]